MTISFFASVCLCWGIVGLLVVTNYGRIGNSTWREAGGTWKHAPAEWFGILCWLVKGTLKDIRDVAMRRKLEPEVLPEPKYDPGHLLRFFVAMSFLCSATFGFAFIAVDRSDYTATLLIVNAVSVLTATAAGLGHLFVAWRPKRARKWRLLVVAMILFIAISSAIGGLHGS